MGNLNSIITLQNLLKGRNDDFDSISTSTTSNQAIQLIRHADNRVGRSNVKKGKELLIDGNPVPAGISNLYELYLYRRDLFDKYQSEQKKGTFDNTKYWVVFLGEKGTSCRFLGVYEITGRHQSPHNAEEEILDLRHLPEFQYLEEKVIIDWGKSTVSWHQYYNNEKEVIRVEEGMAKADGTPVFKGYTEVLLDYSQLKKVLQDPEWIAKLQAINCIYLIKDKSNGKEYVGSTYGSERIYGRWSQYGKTGHGGNVKLEEKIKTDPQYHHKNFQWTILQTLDSYITQQEAIERENLWKRKLLSLNPDFGYNMN